MWAWRVHASYFSNVTRLDSYIMKFGKFLVRGGRGGGVEDVRMVRLEPQSPCLDKVITFFNLHT